MGENTDGDEMALVQFLESVPRLDAVIDAVGCLCPRWSTAESGEDKNDVDRLEEEHTRTAARESSEGICFDSILSTVHFFCVNIGVKPLSRQLP